jgi:hypothetical protein
MRSIVRRISLALALVAPFVETATGMAESRPIESLAPRTTTAAAGLDLAGILSSPFVVDYFELDRLRNRLIRVVSQFALGFKLKQIQNVWLLADADDHMLVLVEGDFNSRKVARRWRRLPRLKEADAAGIVQLSRYEDRDNDRDAEGAGRAASPGYLAAVLDEHWLAVGQEAAVQQLLRVWNERSPALEAGTLAELREGDDQMRASVLDVANWLGADGWIDRFLTGASLDANFTENLDLSLHLPVTDAEAAAGVEHILNGIVLLVAAHPRVTKDPGLAEALERARIVNTGDEVSLHVHVDGSVVDKRARRAARDDR